MKKTIIKKNLNLIILKTVEILIILILTDLKSILFRKDTEIIIDTIFLLISIIEIFHLLVIILFNPIKNVFSDSMISIFIIIPLIIQISFITDFYKNYYIYIYIICAAKVLWIMVLFLNIKYMGNATQKRVKRRSRFNNILDNEDEEMKYFIFL